MIHFIQVVTNGEISHSALFLFYVFIHIHAPLNLVCGSPWRLLIPLPLNCIHPNRWSIFFRFWKPTEITFGELVPINRDSVPHFASLHSEWHTSLVGWGRKPGRFVEIIVPSPNLVRNAPASFPISKKWDIVIPTPVRDLLRVVSNFINIVSY